MGSLREGDIYGLSASQGGYGEGGGEGHQRVPSAALLVKRADRCMGFRAWEWRGVYPYAYSQTWSASLRVGKQSCVRGNTGIPLDVTIGVDEKGRG